MESGDPFGSIELMMADPTENAQVNRLDLKPAAKGICYRAEQLGLAAVLPLTVDWANFKPGQGWIKKFLNNCRIESALVNARGLTEFLSPKSNRDHLHFSDFTDEDYSIPKELNEQMYEAISQHLSHAILDEEEGNPHPGRWPIEEMAFVLLEKLARLAENNAWKPGVDPKWFKPSPVELYNHLASKITSLPSDVSEHPKIGSLTEELRAEIQNRNLLPLDPMGLTHG